ncbi:MAG: CPBP family intramembrane metalloprotease [Actinobacteria bacterium]|nr:CPBP family intramembrane metalloprotease [Actinomycetota bacterium]
MNRDLVLRRAVVLSVLVALPIAKWQQFEQAPGRDGLRQLLLVVVVGVVVLLMSSGSKVEAVIGAHLVRPRPSSFFALGRSARLGLGLSAIGLAAAAVVVLVQQPTGRLPALLEGKDRPYWFVLASLVPLLALILWEVVRARSAASQHPDRAVLWMVAPAVLLFAILLLSAWARERDLDPLVEGAGCVIPKSCPELVMHGAGGRALFTVVVIGLGEEFLYRGLLLVLALAAKLEQLGFALVSLSFAGWHLPDALSSPRDTNTVLLGAGTFVAMFLARIIHRAS